jgi:hypothetical protein
MEGLIVRTGSVVVWDEMVVCVDFVGELRWLRANAVQRREGGEKRGDSHCH